MSVFVLDKRKRPLMPCSEKRARLLLSTCRAVVHRLIPFTIRLKERTRQERAVQPKESMWLEAIRACRGRSPGRLHQWTKERWPLLSERRGYRQIIGGRCASQEARPLSKS